MFYLVRKYNPEISGIEYSFEPDKTSLNDWPKPITIDENVIPKETRDEILRILNGKGSFFTEECNEAKVAFGVGGRDFTNYYTIFGELEEKLDHEGPSFRGPDGRTEGYFRFNIVKPKTDIAIVLKKTSTSFYSEEERRTMETIEGRMYFLKKNQASVCQST